MKKIITICLLGFLVLSLSSYRCHKFYVGVCQVNYAPQKKMLQITCRLFSDDLNKALEKKHKKKTFLGTEKETPEDVILFKKYFAENFSIKINKQTKPITLLSKETEGDVLICYLNSKDISKINSLEVTNTLLTDWNPEQQNIVHVVVLGIKNSFLFTSSTFNGLLNY